MHQALADASVGKIHELHRQMTLDFFESLVNLEEHFRISPTKVQDMLLGEERYSTEGDSGRRKTRRLGYRGCKEIAWLAKMQKQALAFFCAHGEAGRAMTKNGPPCKRSPFVDDGLTLLEPNPVNW